MTHTRFRYRAATLAAALLIGWVGAPVHAWADLTDADRKKIEGIISPLSTDIKQLKMDVANVNKEITDLKTNVAKLKAEVANLKHGGAARRDTESPAYGGPMKIIGIFAFQTGGLDEFLTSLKKWGWHIEGVESNSETGGGTITATKPLDAGSPPSSGGQSASGTATAASAATGTTTATSVVATQYTCSPVYVIQARMSLLRGSCQ
jgi:hypothetical protein